MLAELWTDLGYRLRALLRRDEVEAELDDEVRHHLACEAAKYESLGVPRDEAVRRATLAFGGVDRVKEESRDARGTIVLETFIQDVRYALRGLRARPAFTLGITLTLGLGIGANAAMFGIIDRLLFRAPPYLRDAALVHRVYVSWLSNNRNRVERQVQFPRYLDFVRWTHDFSVVGAFHTWRTAVGDGDDARERRVTAASASYFDLFDARPSLGRFFTVREDSVTAEAPVIVLDWVFWQTAFGGQPDVLGKPLRVGHTLYTIVGVAPEHFVGMETRDRPAVYAPITTFAKDLQGGGYAMNYRSSWIELVVRRRADVSTAAANGDLTEAFRRSWTTQLAKFGTASALGEYHPRAVLGPFQLERGPQVEAQSRVAIWISGVALVVLLIACANVANLLLSRALARRREIALRLALGVSRGRLAGQLLTETLLLSSLGGVLGLAFAQWGASWLRHAFFAAADATVLGDVRTLAVALLIVLCTTILAGAAPLVYALRSSIGWTLSMAVRDANAHSSASRSLLLVIQAALSVMLLVGAGLFVRSLWNVRGIRLGYDVAPLLMIAEHKRGVQMTDIEQRALERRLVEAAATLPGVVGATPVASIPFWASEARPLFVPGIDSVAARGEFFLQTGNPEYFRVVGTRILRGRAFDARDGEQAPRVAVVSEGMASALWPGVDPLGRCLRIGDRAAPCTTVIGVAEETRLRSLADAREFTYYLPAAQYGEATGMLLVRVTGDAAHYAERVRHGLQRAMPGNSYVSAEPFGDAVDPTMESWRFGATMFLVFGGLALLLAGVGLYSVLAYTVAQRRREIGIRIALGGRPAVLVRTVVLGAVRLVLVGIGAGLLLAFGSSRSIAQLLFQESATDPAVYAVVGCAVLTVALMATILPAAAAAHVDPNEALRDE